MTQRCTNCGAELFDGQQFCRQCGQRTQPLAGEAPTRILGQDAPPQPSAASTTFLPSQRHTGETMWGPRHTGAQTVFPGHRTQTSHLAAEQQIPHAPPRKSRRWIVPAVLVLLLIGAVGGALAVIMFARGPRVVIQRHGEMPPHPPGVPMFAGNLLDEAGATVTAEETVITKSFELGEGATFSLKSLQGEISVQGWDGDRVEVKLTKRGGSAEERAATRITLEQDDDTLALATAGNTPVKTIYEIKLPRSLERVELSSRNGGVKVTGFEGALDINLHNGGLKLEDVRGPVEANLINGGIDVTYQSAERGGAQEFSTVNGGVQIRLADGMDADLKATVVNGRIEVDARHGFQPQKRTPGWSLDARVGGGGEPITVKSVNGSISFR